MWERSDTTTPQRKRGKGLPLAPWPCVSLTHDDVELIMARFLCFFGTPLKRLLHARIPISTPTIGLLFAGLSILGVIGLAYLYGAAVMFFQLPSCVFLDRAFGGAKAWCERGQSTIPLLPPDEAKVAREKEGISVDKAEKTWDGFTLYTTTFGARATLIDMRGTVVHHWELPFSRAWTHPPHIQRPIADEQIHWFNCHLYPNGDLLAIYHADGDTPYGYGLVKLDKDSKLLWTYANNVHHDVEVDEDGTIYTLTQQIVSEPSAGLEFQSVPYLTDYLVVLSPQGRELQNIPLAEVIANSPYALTLTSDRRIVSPFGYGPSVDPKKDLLHTNSAKVLKRAWAAKFPMFQAGQVLLSLRNLGTIAVLDLHTCSLVWASQGVWYAQHDAEFLDNGHLLLFDNLGAQHQTRVLEYDPQTQGVPWAYSNEGSPPFRAAVRGMTQRLPNGNTLIVDPAARRLFEVTPRKELVWENYCPLSPLVRGHLARNHSINSARRYTADDLTFLKGRALVRP
jgi:hypothetical protein